MVLFRTAFVRDGTFFADRDFLVVGFCGIDCMFLEFSRVVAKSRDAIFKRWMATKEFAEKSGFERIA